MNRITRILAAALFAFQATTLPAGEVEVLHFWTSPGEAESLNELKALIAVRGHTWKDFAVVGGGGGNAMVSLRARVLANNPPASASLKGPAIQEWASLNALTSLDAMAQFAHWDKVVPPVVQQHMKHRGRYVAVPVNIHRNNWMWSSAEVLQKAGIKEPPTTFPEFMAALQKVKTAGYVPLAHGGQPWQDFVLFESVALGVGGADFYRRALVDLDPAALTGKQMTQTLEAFRSLKPFVDAQSEGRDWDATTQMVIGGKAAFQIMGDWAKGEFTTAGRQSGQHYFCTPSPGTAGAYAYVVDSFAMFQLRNWEAQRAQGYLAYTLLGEEFQRKFNLRKGSIPVRMDLPMKDFDGCAQRSHEDFKRSEKAGGLLPSVSIGMATSTAKQAILQAAISDFWRNDRTRPDEMVARLVTSLQADRP